MSSQEPYCRVDTYRETTYRLPQTWSEKFTQWKRSKWNGGHQLLTSSPTLSTCTTATNLSTLEFQSNSTINQQIRKTEHLRENLRMAQPEIEPLHKTIEVKNDLNVNSSTLDLENDEELASESSITLRTKIPQLMAAIAVSLVSMVIGYVSGYTSPAELSLKTDFNLNQTEVSWISGLMPILAVFGGFMGGPLIEYLGRKYTLLLTDILFLTGMIIFYFASNVWFMYISRMISGCSVGIATLTFPVYLGETVQPEVRGSLGLLPTAFGNSGILLCYLLGNVFQWKGLAGMGVLLTIPFLVIIWIIPETPSWYSSKGKTEQARAALQWLRGKNNNIDKEFNELVKNQKISDEKNDHISDLWTFKYMKPLLIVLGLMFIQQMTGINAVIFYTTNIFSESGSNLEALICTTIVGVVNLVSAFIATALIDKLGRKVLLYISAISVILTLAILGTYFYLLKVYLLDLTTYSWLPLTSFIIYILGFSLGFGPIPWLMMGELLPARIRGSAASVATAFNWICTSIVTTTFPLLVNIIGFHSMFWMFGGITVLGLMFTIFLVPETQGQSLEDIERKMAGVKVRRMSSVANLKPLPSTF